MKVIVKADVKGSGKKGDILEVSDGYAKNFLIKKGLAEPATASGVNAINQQRTAQAFHKAENERILRETAAKLNGTEVTVPIRAGENGKTFGSVTTGQISAALEEMGYEIDKKKIVLKDQIKQLGVYEVEIRFMEKVSSKIKINVVAL